MEGKITFLKDEEIVKLVQGGRLELFGFLVERYEDKMLRYARKFLANQEDAKDMVQNVFIKSFKNIKSFNTKRSFSTWLYRIAHNEFVNYLKKKKRKPLLFFDISSYFPHHLSQESPESEISKQEAIQMLSNCLDKLEVKHKEVLILYYFEELSYKKIADIMQIPISSVGVKIYRAKQKLKNICSNLKNIN